jgi:hypothetical protein
MFEKYMLLTRGFRNVSKNGQVTGFQVGVRITYYRGIYVSLIEGFDVNIDGEDFGPEKISFSIGNRSFPITDIGTAIDIRWHFGDVATLTIEKPGGLPPGLHDILLTEKLRLSYHATNRKTRLSVARMRKKMTLVE